MIELIKTTEITSEYSQINKDVPYTPYFIMEIGKVSEITHGAGSGGTETGNRRVRPQL